MIKTLSEEEYKNVVSENTREKLYYATACSNALYSMFFDIHNNLKKQNAYLDKNLIHNYKRVTKLTESLKSALLHLGYTKGVDDYSNEQIVAIADILEIFIKLIIDRVSSAFSEDFNIVKTLYEELVKLPSHNLLKIAEPDWEELLLTFTKQE